MTKTKACRITSGGNSTFKNIIHFITPNDTKVLAENLEDVLNFIDKNLNVNSVAIPAIGTGKILNFQENLAVKIF